MISETKMYAEYIVLYKSIKYLLFVKKLAIELSFFSYIVLRFYKFSKMFHRSWECELWVRFQFAFAIYVYKRWRLLVLEIVVSLNEHAKWKGWIRNLGCWSYILCHFRMNLSKQLNFGCWSCIFCNSAYSWIISFARL